MTIRLLTAAALALSTGIAFAGDVVRMGTEGAYPHITSSMMPARLTALSANWVTSSARVLL